MSTDSVEAGALLAFIERTERSAEDKRATTDHVKDIYAEAKGTGFDVNILRKIVAARR